MSPSLTGLPWYFVTGSKDMVHQQLEGRGGWRRGRFSSRYAEPDTLPNTFPKARDFRYGFSPVYIAHRYVYKAHMTMDRIFAAAKAVLEQDGIAGLTIRKVAQSAQMSTMAMYRHFADKNALLNALMADGLRACSSTALAAAKIRSMVMCALYTYLCAMYTGLKPYRKSRALGNVFGRVSGSA
jgi:hypothetical protein